MARRSLHTGSLGLGLFYFLISALKKITQKLFCIPISLPPVFSSSSFIIRILTLEWNHMHDRTYVVGLVNCELFQWICLPSKKCEFSSFPVIMQLFHFALYNVFTSVTVFITCALKILFRNKFFEIKQLLDGIVKQKIF